MRHQLLLAAALLQPVRCEESAWFRKYGALAGTQVRSENEPVHFYSIGDWGSQPYSSHFGITVNGGSMHNSCSMYPNAERCKYHSDDWYREENAQRAVMEQMRGLAASKPPKFIINVGDNFYFEGVTGTNHWHWRDSFENMYSDAVFQVPWLSVVGNHDYGGDCCAHDLFGGGADASGIFSMFTGTSSALANFDYDTDRDWEWPAPKPGTRWVAPDHNYTKVMDLGPYKVQFFAIDSVASDVVKQCFRCGGCRNVGYNEHVRKRGCPAGEGQCNCYLTNLFHDELDWLEGALRESSRDPTIAWRFLIAHHPFNFWPGSGRDRLLGLLAQYRVQVHFAGHVHSMRHDVLQGGVQMVMTGSSGGYQYDSGSAPHGDPHGRTVWSSHHLDYGFAHMEMTKHTLKVTYINDKGETSWSTTINSGLARESTTVLEELPWGPCDNLCATGRRTRALRCREHEGEGAAETHMDRCEGLAKPPTESVCSPDAPAIHFCEVCSTSSFCNKCAKGFQPKLDGSGCVNVDKRMLVEYVVEVPTGDEWREELDGMLEHMLNNVSGARLGVTTHHVYPAPAGTPLDSSALASGRRPYTEPFIVSASLPLPHQGTAKKIAQELRRHSEQPGSYYGGPHSHTPDLSAVLGFKILCPGGAPPSADGGCTGDVADEATVTV